MSAGKNLRSYKLHITNAFSGQLLIVPNRSKTEPYSNQNPQVPADALSIMVNDSGSEIQSTDTGDLSGSEGLLNHGQEAKCLKTISENDRNSDIKCLKKLVSILKQPPPDSTDSGSQTNTSDSDAAAKCLKVKAVAPKDCLKKKKNKSKKKASETESSVAESTESTESADALSAEPSSASESEIAAATSSEKESDQETSNLQEAAASSEQSEGIQTAEDASVSKQSERTRTADAPSINHKSDGTRTTEDPSINDKSEGTQTAEDDKPAEQPASASNPSAAGDGWTLSKTALLRSMKEGGETWATIASAISMNKNSCKARWKELSTSGDYGGDDKNDGQAKKYTKGKGKNSAETNKEEKKAKAADEKPATEETTPADNNITTGGTTANDADNEVSTVDGKKQKQQKKAKLPEKFKQIMKEKNMGKRGGGSGEGASSVPCSKTASWLDIHGSYYASAQVPDPTSGSGWTAEDCAVLGTLERKRRVERWLVLQAEFFNATGRMVSVELLKDKVGDKTR